MWGILVRLRALMLLVLLLALHWPAAAQTCQNSGSSDLCAVTDLLWPRANQARSDNLLIFNQIDLSQAQRLMGTSLKWSLRDHEEQAGAYVMAKHELSQTPRSAAGKFGNTPSSQLDRNTINTVIVGWDMVDASRYMALAVGRQWSTRTNASQTLLLSKSQAPILSATYIDRWRSGWILSVNTDVDALLRGVNLKTSVQRDIGLEMMLGPELSLYQDNNYQRQRLGAVLSGLKLTGTDYTLAIGAESDSLSHRGLFSTLMLARRF